MGNYDPTLSKKEAIAKFRDEHQSELEDTLYRIMYRVKICQPEVSENVYNRAMELASNLDTEMVSNLYDASIRDGNGYSYEKSDYGSEQSEWHQTNFGKPKSRRDPDYFSWQFTFHRSDEAAASIILLAGEIEGEPLDVDIKDDYARLSFDSALALETKNSTHVKIRQMLAEKGVIELLPDIGYFIKSQAEEYLTQSELEGNILDYALEIAEHTDVTQIYSGVHQQITNAANIAEIALHLARNVRRNNPNSNDGESKLPSKKALEHMKNNLPQRILDFEQQRHEQLHKRWEEESYVDRTKELRSNIKDAAGELLEERGEFVSEKARSLLEELLETLGEE